MNLLLAEVIDNIPSEFTVKRITRASITYQSAKKRIVISWRSSGLLHLVEYYENGQRHRPISEGPAILHWNQVGEMFRKSYYENNQTTGSFFYLKGVEMFVPSNSQTATTILP